MKKSAIRVALSFATFNKDQLNSLLILLLVCLKTNPLFPNLPVKYADLQAHGDGFSSQARGVQCGRRD